MANNVPAQDEGQVAAELRALIKSVRGDLDSGESEVQERQNASNFPLDTPSRLRISNIAQCGILVGKLVVRPRFVTSILELIDVLVERGIIKGQEEASDEQVGLRSPNDLPANHGESVDGVETPLVEVLGLPVSLAARVWEVCRSLMEANRRFPAGGRGLVELAKQIIVASVTMPEVVESVFHQSSSLDLGSSIDRRTLAVSFDHAFSDSSTGWMQLLATPVVQSESLSERFAEYVGYETFDDYLHAKCIEHNEQVDILADASFPKEIIDLLKVPTDTKEVGSAASTVKDVIGVLQPGIRRSTVDQFRHLTGHESRTITAEGMVGMGISERKRNGAYVTPQRVVDLMLELTMPAPGESVYDPCFGVGGLLVGAAYRQTAGAIDGSNTSSDSHKARIFGVERDLLPYSVGLCRLTLADVDHSGLVFDDALNPRAPLPRAGAEAGFDCVLAAPPWGRSAESNDAFPLPGESTESQFVRHVMDNLAPAGRAVVALPEGPLFRDEDRPLREALLSGYRVDGVVSLPAGALEPCTSLPMNLLVFSRAARHETVRFARFSREAWDTLSSNGDDGVRQDEPRRLPGERAARSTELMRALSALITHRQATTSEVLPSGVQVWDVPIGELEIRDHELIAKMSGSEELDIELKRLLETEPSLKIDTLGRLAEVWGGVSYEARFRVRPGDRSDVVAGLVYPGDVTDHGIRPPTWFLSPEGAASVKEEAYLRSGDFVVTTSGSVGNIGLVDDSMSTMRMLPTTGLAQIRARSGIDSRFLAAILRSPVYGAWLSGHVRGPIPSIRHLRLRDLRGLKIPVPPLSVQEAVIEELRERRADALAVLARLMSGTPKSPIASWLETRLASQLAVTARVSSGLETLVEAAQGIRSLSTPPGDDGGTRAWLAEAQRAAAALDDVGSIPPGAGRLAVLEFALARFHEGLAALGDDERHVIERLRSVTRVLLDLAQDEVDAMQRSITLDLDVEPIEVVAGDTSEVVVRASNASAVPLRNVQLVARCPDGTIEERAADYVAERGTHDLPIAVRPTGEERSLQIAVEWRARRFDGQHVPGDRAVLSLLVRDNRAQYGTGVEAGDLGPNPYITGHPVAGPELFGREGVVERIRRQLGASDHANVVLLEGTRRTGKTSILKHIEKTDVLGGWIPVYCSLQGMGIKSTRDFYRALAMKTGSALYRAGVQTWLPEIPGASPGQRFKEAFRSAVDRAFSGEHSFETFRLYLAAAVEAAKPRRVLLMLDEFDELQERIDDGTISTQVPTNIRHLLQHQPGVCAIITGSRRLKRLREDYWSALFGLGYRIGISGLPIDAAKRLVAKPVEGKLRYLPSACDRLVELCSCHPFLVQLLSSRVFDLAAAGEDRTIDKGVVDRAATDMVGDNEHFQTLWGYARTERRRLLLMLCARLAEGPDPVNLDLLGMTLEECGVEIRGSTALVDDIAELRELELLDFDDSYRGGTYRIAVPLMAMWLQQNVALDELVARARLQERD